ncbi:RNA polymerase II transcription initiation protein [Teratosphaeria nubilosa]|uniref:RNA polymerase II transcription factor B subunit 2 n=1 Tax=Teratosphaeria nubilosa TaxID=161662 RepID=A0A6G1L9Q6_9PEZI|nr:RNA polymerase II transcription initiation protein [Teratosphaeria nubilosa]
MSSTASQRVLDYLEALPAVTSTKLFHQPSTALAIFRRMLPHLAKTIVMAMLYMPTPLAVTNLDVWIKPNAESAQARDKAVSILLRLRILQDESSGIKDAKGRPAYKLTPIFAKSLRMALTGGGNHRSFGVPATTPDKTPISVEYLDSFARKQWESILYYVVGSANSALSSGVAISPGTQQLLQKGGFVALQGKPPAPFITTGGFTFLLQEINAQIWSLLIVYLQVAPELQMSEVEVLSFLFTLGSLELGTSYSTDNLTPTQRQMLDDLADFGLVYKRSDDADRYYPTRLATTLTSDAPALLNNALTSTTVASSSDSLEATANDKGYIILETNYRLYAYTSSPLLISILSLFAQLNTRFPNLVTAKITKTSTLRAISAGITSKQIITYLQTHAHPILRHHTPILPPTVVDQIRLWQIEGERMTSFPGFLIRDVGSAEEFEKAVAYAEALGILRKTFPKRGWFFVSRMEQMQAWFRTQAARKKAEREAREREAAGAVGAGRK